MADINPYRYSSYRYDAKIGLYYLIARYYDSNVGRFINSDTFLGFEDEPSSSNLYNYTKNNPVLYVDPDGHWWNFVVVALVSGVKITLKYGGKHYKTFKKQKLSKAQDALSGFKNKSLKIGKTTIKLDHSDMTHILTRHHPKYWTGKVKEDQTFLNPAMTITDITNAIQTLLEKNKGYINKMGTNRAYGITGKIAGKKMLIWIDRGKIESFYPTKKQ